MTWRTELGERTLKGAEANLIRESVAFMADMIDEEMFQQADSWEYDIQLFDRLALPSKLAILTQVATALLRETDVCPPLTAINEATVAAIYANVEQCLQAEIEYGEYKRWRTCVLAVFEELADVRQLPRIDSKEWDKWELLVENLRFRVLWDDDLNDADCFLDADPTSTDRTRYLLGIDPNYYSSIPPDPGETELPMIRELLRDLCESRG